MLMSTAFTSKYLKAADIPIGTTVRVTVESVTMENVGDDADIALDKPVLRFTNKRRAMILNRTNSDTIVGKYGDDSDRWVGRELVLYVGETDFKGRRVPALRVKVPDDQAAPAPTTPAPPAQPVAAAAGGDGDIPF